MKILSHPIVKNCSRYINFEWFSTAWYEDQNIVIIISKPESAPSASVKIEETCKEFYHYFKVHLNKMIWIDAMPEEYPCNCDMAEFHLVTFEKITERKDSAHFYLGSHTSLSLSEVESIVCGKLKPAKTSKVIKRNLLDRILN